MATRKLLLADDSVTIQKVVNLTFADEGMEVTSVGDGDRAVEKIEETMPDIVLADVHMPGLNGYQVCNFIKREPQLSHIPVILLVGSFEPFDEEEARKVKADDYLTKPFQSIRQLVSRVNALLPQKPLEQPVLVEQAAAAEEEEEPRPFIEEFSQPTLVRVQQDDMTPPPTARMPEVNDTWTPPPAPQTQTTSHAFSDSAFDDELMETTSVSDASDESSKPPTVSTNLPRETTRLSAEEVKELNITLPTNVVSSKEDEYIDIDVSTPLSQSVSDSEHKEPEKETPVSEFAPVETETATEIKGSPYSTTPLSEDTLLDLNYADMKAPETEDEDSILDLGEDIYAPIATYDMTNETVDVAVDSASNVRSRDLHETTEFEEDAMPSSIETISTTPVIETISAPPTSIPMSVGSLSPEIIDAIARRVVEMMSDKVVREIAWEVVPDLADLHIKRKMEEKKL